MSTLKNLNNTGNNFIQQVDQLGEFQDKYSERIEEILESRRNDRNNDIDTKIQNLTMKIDKLNSLYDSFNDDYNIPNLDQAVLQPYRQISITTGSGHIVLNVTPVQYTVTEQGETEGETLTNQYYLKRHGAYLINAENNDHYVHYSKYYELDGSPQVMPIQTDENVTYSGQHWKLSYTRPQSDNNNDNYQIPDAFQNYFSTMNNNEAEQDSDNDIAVISTNNRANWNILQKKDFYFYIVRINNIQEYNAIILKTQGESALISSNTNIKFPFYLIESARRPGYLLKVLNSSTSNNISLYVDKANNSPDEKFTNVGVTGTATRCGS